MERMAFEGDIDPTPMDRVPLRVRETLCLRPGTTVDHCHFGSNKRLASLIVVEDVEPNPDDKDFFMRGGNCARRINHNCTGKLRVFTVPFLERAVGGCTPATPGRRQPSLVHTFGFLSGLRHEIEHQMTLLCGNQRMRSKKGKATES